MLIMNESYTLGTPIEYQVHDTQVDIGHTGDLDPVYGYIATAYLQPMAQGPSKVVQDDSIEDTRDSVYGFTNPNLHRRVDPNILDSSGEELDHIKELELAYESAKSIYENMIGESSGCCACHCCVADDESETIPEAYQNMIDAREALDSFLSTTSAYEVVPREYQLDVLGLNSHRTTIKNTHVDYQDLDSYIAKHPDKRDEILERFQHSEEMEIP